MKLPSWNCRGFGNKSKVEALKDLVKIENTSVILLQETKLEETIALENETKEIKNSIGMAISSNRAFGGIVTLWDEKLCNLDVSLCANHCILIVLKNKYFGIKFLLINIYMPNSYSNKLDYWSSMFAMKDLM
jgi:exonuclease III